VLADVRTAGIAPGALDAVGYRVVHGGEPFTAPTRLDDDVLAGIEALAELAPLHDPVAVEVMRAARAALPGVPHVAAFDTAFHATLPPDAVRYPVPEAWVRRGIRRYGFHGLSVEWSTQRAAELLDRPVAGLRLLVAHLGGGCSVTAVDGGRSVETSMGLTPLEGLMMATRAGSIDPGAILALWRAGVPLEEVSADLERRSGLLGVSGRSGDLREVLAAADAGDAAAALAVDLFVRRAAAGIAAAATTVPTVDVLVFTGGIGEHASGVRARICERLRTLGVPAVGDVPAGEDAVLARGDAIAVLRVRAREDLVIATAALEVARAAG
jgi:acetate kinase